MQAGMKKHTIIILSAIAMASSCSFLDSYPQDVVTPDDYYTTTEEVENALRGVYVTLANSALYGGTMLSRMGLSADIGFEGYANDYNGVGYNLVPATDAFVRNYWMYWYQGIGNANRLLENLEKAGLDEADYDRIKGEAIFLRAYFHYMLTVRFANIPVVTSVPKTGNLEDVQIEQTPQEDVLKFIVSEMETASRLVLPASEVPCGGQVNKSAVWGILARVCLFASGEPCRIEGMNEKAKSYARKVIDSGLHELNPDYKDVFMKYLTDEYDIKESILEVEFYGNNTGSYNTLAGCVGQFNGIMFKNKNQNRDDIGISSGHLVASGYLYDLYKDDDLRRDWNIADFLYDNDGNKVSPKDNWTRFCGKFRRECEAQSPKNATYTSINFPLLRYSDVLLMYTESVVCDPSATAAEQADAMECINKVRRRAYGLPIGKADADVDLTYKGKEQMMSEIMDERARELAFELLRKDDLVRWGKYYEQMKLVLNIIPASGTSTYYTYARLYYGNVRQRDIVWPIPSYEISVNRKLVQNPGW